MFPVAETAVLYVAVSELWTPSMANFLEGLEGSGWLKHIKAVLDAGVFVAKVGLEGQTSPLLLLSCVCTCVCGCLCTCLLSVHVCMDVCVDVCA